MAPGDTIKARDDAGAKRLDSTVTRSKTRSSMITPSSLNAAPSDTVFPFFRLPIEIRDEIYFYASLTEHVWIGRPPRSIHDSTDAIIENESMYMATTLIKTDHSLIAVCHETRDAFRAAVWRDYMTGNRYIHIRVHDFAFGHLEELLARCSEPEVKKLQKQDKCRVQHHITTDFHKYRRSHYAYWDVAELLHDWVLFKARTFLVAEQSIDKCDWYDARLLRTTIMNDKLTHVPDWEERWQCPGFSELGDAVSDAYVACYLARSASRDAFRKPTSLGQ